MSLMVQETCMVYLRLRGIITCDFCPTANVKLKVSLSQFTGILCMKKGEHIGT